MFNKPDVNNETIIPEVTPPIVSIENDFPGVKLLEVLAKEISLTKVNPGYQAKWKKNKKSKD